MDNQQEEEYAGPELYDKISEEWKKLAQNQKST